MTDQDKTRDQLLLELATLQRRVAVLETNNRRNNELTLFNRIIAASASGLEPDIILETACHELALAFNSPHVTAAMFNIEQGTSVVVAEFLTKGKRSTVNYAPSFKDSPTIQALLQNKVPLIIDSTQQTPNLQSICNLLLEQNKVSKLFVPLIIEGNVAGNLEIEMAATHNFSSEEEGMAQSVADQVASAISKLWINEERHLLSTAIQQAADIILITDDKGIILYANPAFEHITGYNRKEIVGKTQFIPLNSDTNSEYYDQLWATVKTGQAWHGHITNQKKDGSFYTTDATITPVKNETGTIINFVSTQHDVTRELELEKQYRQAQKMEAVGQLTAGIAHDFNNLLMAINGFAELMQFRLPEDSPFQEMAGRIVASGESAANLIRQLLIFSRKQSAEAQIINLNDTVIEIDKILQRIIGEDINLQITLDPNLWSAKIDPTQVEQIIANLAVNGRDAMPTGGQLAITTTNTELFEINPHDPFGIPPGDYVLMAVSDTGSGISESVITHIFDPFFTTKEQGKGTGLGLATVYGIVKQNGGNIQVRSKEGHGTTFEILLPRAVELPEGEVEKEQFEKMSQGTETVLLVEDSPAVKELVTFTLSEQGYYVVSANNGEQALKLFQNYSGEIDLLLTDVIMPQMNGKELADRITAQKPDTKIIFTSGYSDDILSQYGVLNPKITFLQKPFSPVALVSKIREVLDVSP